MARLSGQERRKQIIDAAIEVILRKGLAQSATRDVTRALGVGTGLLHHYFASWSDLRAEAVRTAARREILEVEALVAGVPAIAALHRIADWMIADDDMRHWRLWLNAMDEAHRDDRLADVMNNALRDWHRLVATLLRDAAIDARVHPADIEAAAWRLTALMDGLAAAMLIGTSAVTATMARDLIRAQLNLEIGQHAP